MSLVGLQCWTLASSLPVVCIWTLTDPNCAMCHQLSLSGFILRYCDTDECLGKIGDTTCRMVILVLAKSGEKSRVLSNRTMQFGIEMLGASGSIVKVYSAYQKPFWLCWIWVLHWSLQALNSRQVTASAMLAEYLNIGKWRRIRSLQSSRLLEPFVMYIHDTCVID